MKIEVKNLTKEFKNEIILNDINITLTPGIYGFTGRNGSGKTVFLKLLCGFYTPTKGEILFDGVDIFKNNSFPPNTRALIENPKFLPNQTGYENLKLLAEIQNKIGDKEIIETLKMVDLYDEKDKKYHKYSLGMKQKLGIAQVLMENPEVLILDEPFNGIDEKSAIKIKEILKHHQNKIIIISSHIKEDIEDLAQNVYKFEDANVVPVKYN